MLDSNTVTKWFPQLLSAGANKFKSKSYSLLGKITTGDKFDLLVLLEDKKRSDSSEIQVTYLITTKKNGDYIASLKAAVNGTKKKSGSSYNISSWLYPDLKLVQDSRIMANNQSYNDMVSYKISNGGRFILQ
jgi:2-keto-4-pentenoate hydratase